jgi:hypothetical protein
MTEFVKVWFLLVAVVAGLLVFLVVEVRRIRIATQKIAARSKTEQSVPTEGSREMDSGAK